MKAFLRLSVAVVGCFAMAACSQPVEKKVDVGTFDGATYRNESFGMTLELPEGWHLTSDEAKAEIMDAGSRVIAGDDSNLNTVFEAAQPRTFNMFVAFKHPYGTPVRFNPNIILTAERVSHAPGIRSGADYLAATRQLLEQGALEITVNKETQSLDVDGETFHWMEAETRVMGMTITQRILATVIEGYALVFTLSYVDAEDAEALLETVDSIRFDRK
ncbi:MAG: hypothetical protein ACFB21_11200 [Opitutales bacterium]